MTTIAYDGELLAADSQRGYCDANIGVAFKIRRVRPDSRRIRSVASMKGD